MIEQKKKVHKTLLFTQDTYITIIFFYYIEENNVVNNEGKGENKKES